MAGRLGSALVRRTDIVPDHFYSRSTVIGSDYTPDDHNGEEKLLGCTPEVLIKDERSKYSGCPPANAEKMRESVYGSITITVEESENQKLISSLPQSPKYLLELDQDLLIEALGTSLDECFSTTGVANLTGNVKTNSLHAMAHGGFADIFYGEWESEDTTAEGPRQPSICPVAVKVLRVINKHDISSGRLRRRLDREVAVWHGLCHPNIAKFFGTTYHMGGRPAMVMQWYENGSAIYYLKTKNPDANRLMLIRDVANGLNYLHTMQPPIVHGDLKGTNVLITDDNRAVLSDFGLSKIIDELITATGSSSSSLAGSIRWQAPELILPVNEGLKDQLTPARSVNRATDIWSFGCTAYEFLTGRLPYAHRRQDWWVVLDINDGKKPAQPEDGLFGYDQEDVWKIMDSCWSFSPLKRPSMMELVVKLCGS